MPDVNTNIVFGPKETEEMVHLYVTQKGLNLPEGSYEFHVEMREGEYTIVLKRKP